MLGRSGALRVAEFGRALRQLADGTKSSSRRGGTEEAKQRSRLAQRVLGPEEERDGARKDSQRSQRGFITDDPLDSPQGRPRERGPPRRAQRPQEEVENEASSASRSRLRRSSPTAQRKPRSDPPTRARPPPGGRRRQQKGLFSSEPVKPFEPMLRTRKDHLNQPPISERIILDEHAQPASLDINNIKSFSSLQQQQDDFSPLHHRFEQHKSRIMQMYGLESDEEWEQIKGQATDLYEQKRNRILRDARRKGRSGLPTARDEDNMIDNMIEQAREHASPRRLAFGQKAALALKHNPNVPFTAKQHMMRLSLR